MDESKILMVCLFKNSINTSASITVPHIEHNYNYIIVIVVDPQLQLKL